jgi:hypothetical protein
LPFYILFNSLKHFLQYVEENVRVGINNSFTMAYGAMRGEKSICLMYNEGFLKQNPGDLF